MMMLQHPKASFVLDLCLNEHQREQLKVLAPIMLLYFSYVLLVHVYTISRAI